jgi:hypothetical protein
MEESAASDAPRTAIPGQVRNGSRVGAADRRKIPIETLVRSVAIVGALFYVLGFLTTNAYLYKHGVSPTQTRGASKYGHLPAHFREIPGEISRVRPCARGATHARGDPRQ